MAVAIATLIVIGGQTLIAHALRASQESSGRVTAHGLLQESLAAVQALSRESGEVFTVSGSYHTVVQEGEWRLMAGSNERVIDGRRYTTDLMFDASAKKVTYHVSWDQDVGRPHEIAYVHDLVDWRTAHAQSADAGYTAGMWALDDTAGDLQDSSGAGNTLISYGIVRYAESGIHGNAIGFSGNASYGEIVDGSQRGLDGAGPLTIQVYVNPDVLTGTVDVVSKWGAGNDRSYQISLMSNGRVRLQLQGEDGGVLVLQPEAGVVSDRQWAKVVATYDGVRARISVDDVLVAESRDWSEEIKDSTAPFRLGSNGGAGSAFTGRLDDVRISRSIQ